MKYKVQEDYYADFHGDRDCYVIVGPRKKALTVFKKKYGMRTTNYTFDLKEAKKVCKQLNSRK